MNQKYQVTVEDKELHSKWTAFNSRTARRKGQEYTMGLGEFIVYEDWRFHNHEAQTKSLEDWKVWKEGMNKKSWKQEYSLAEKKASLILKNI